MSSLILARWSTASPLVIAPSTHLPRWSWRIAVSTLPSAARTACSIGEVIGLAIGVEAGLSAAATIALATTLACISGFALGLWPVMKQRGLSLLAAFKLIWIGEAVSIGVMEVAMN